MKRSCFTTTLTFLSARRKTEAYRQKQWQPSALVFLNSCTIISIKLRRPAMNISTQSRRKKGPKSDEIFNARCDHIVFETSWNLLLT